MFHAEKDTHEEEDMERQKRQGAEYEFYGKLPLKKAIPLGLQHVLAMFVGNLTPILIISGACGIAGEEFGSLQVDLLQNAMLIAGIVTLIQLFAIGPVGGKVPIIMGTSSGFIGVFNSVVQVMGGGILAYGAIMCASVIGGLFEGILGFLLKPLRRFFPAVVTGTVVLSIGLSLIAVGVNSFGGGNTANDFGSVENLLLGAAVLLIIVAVKHWMKGMASASSILIGIVAGYIIAAIMGLVLPTTAVNADGVEYTKAWVLNWDKVANAAWFSVPKLMPVKLVFDWRAIIPVLIMFVVTAVETVGDISGVMEGGMGREATDKELSGGVICDGIGSSLAALFGVLPNTSFSQNVGLVTMTENRKPYGACIRSRIPDFMWFIPETCSTDFNHAAECTWRSCRYDVFIHRDQRNPAYYQRTDDDAQYHDRLRRIGTWLWNRIQQRHPCTSAAGHPADLWRFRYCSGSHCGDHL